MDAKDYNQMKKNEALSDLIYEMRQELNELRERIAVLEKRPQYPSVTLPPVQPQWTSPASDPYFPPYRVTCGGTDLGYPKP